MTLPASGRVVAQLTLGLEPGRYRLELRLPEDPRSADNRRQSLLVAVAARRGCSRSTAMRKTPPMRTSSIMSVKRRGHLIITTRLRSSRSRRVRSTARRSKRRTSCCSRTSPGLTRVCASVDEFCPRRRRGVDQRRLQHGPAGAAASARRSYLRCRKCALGRQGSGRRGQQRAAR